MDEIKKLSEREDEESTAKLFEIEKEVRKAIAEKETEAIPTLIKKLKSEDESEILSAMAILGDIVRHNTKELAGLADAVPALVALAKNHEPISPVAIKLLGRIRNTSAILHLEEIARNTTYEFISDEIIDSVCNIIEFNSKDPAASDAIPFLVDMYDQEEYVQLKRRILISLSCIKDERVNKLVVEALEADDWELRTAAFEAIEDMICENPENTVLQQAKPRLIAALEEEYVAIQDSASRSLGFFGDIETIPNLIKVATDPKKPLPNAWMTMGEIVSKNPDESGMQEPIIGMLLSVLIDESKDLETRKFAALGLGEIGEPALESFNQAYLEFNIPYELAQSFYERLEGKLKHWSGEFEKGTVAPPKKPPGNPDEMKRIALRRMSGKTKPKTQDTGQKTLKRCIEGG
jgi:HEAT repeat protein